ETDKANLEVEAQEAGVLRKIFHREGELCQVLVVIGVIGGQDEVIDFEAIRKEVPSLEKPTELSGPEPSPRPIAPLPPGPGMTVEGRAFETKSPAQGLAQKTRNGDRVFVTPLARRIAKERGIDLRRMRGTGPGGRILRRDV